MKMLLTLLFALVLSWHQIEGTPAYAKFGRIAVKEVQSRYQVVVIDYKHIGVKNYSPNLSEENFKLWVRNSYGKEYGVFVCIRFNPRTDEIIKILFRESAR